MTEVFDIQELPQYPAELTVADETFMQYVLILESSSPDLICTVQEEFYNRLR